MSRTIRVVIALGLIASLAPLGCAPRDEVAQKPEEASKQPADGKTPEESSGDSVGSDSVELDDEAQARLEQPVQLEEGSVDEDGAVVLLGDPATPSEEVMDFDPVAETSTETELTLDAEPPQVAEPTLSPQLPLDQKAPSSQASAASESLELEPRQASDPTQGKSALASNKSAVNEPDEKQNASSKVAVANQATESEKNQVIAKDWPKPEALLFVSGQQHGYIEPCGCTGLENQKGGLIRRDTLLSQLKDRGWDLVPLDVGNQVRRRGRQAEIKFSTTVDALKNMGYVAATLGKDDLNLSSIELIQAASSDDITKSPFILSNVSIIAEDFFPDSQIIEVGSRKIGVIAVLGDEFAKEVNSPDITVAKAIGVLPKAIEKLKKQGVNYTVLLAHATLEESREFAKKVPGIDLVVTAGGFGEPTFELESIEDTKTQMVQVGTKGMFAGIIGLYDDEKQPVRYQRIAISSQFKDSKRMLAMFADYQRELKQLGFDGLGLNPVKHPSGNKYVGSEVCGDCHSTAYDVWKESPHVHATDSIVSPANDRGGIERHFDPECVACHATGWKVPRHDYQPYESGYADLKSSAHLLGSGCENCHGPGSAHVAAQNGDIEADTALMEKLNKQMVLSLENAKDRCMQCHDLDNSPDFSFEEYWEQVKHYGLD